MLPPRRSPFESAQLPTTLVILKLSFGGLLPGSLLSCTSTAHVTDIVPLAVPVPVKLHWSFTPSALVSIHVSDVNADRWMLSLVLKLWYSSSPVTGPLAVFRSTLKPKVAASTSSERRLAEIGRAHV